MLHRLHHRLRPVAVVVGYVNLYAICAYPLTLLPPIATRMAAVALAVYGVVRLRRWRLARRTGSVPAGAQ